MSATAKPRKGAIDRAIQACLDNADRLLEETYDLEFRTPCATRYFLTIIAQEEVAKAFILYLVREGVAPFSPALRRAIRDHACKHLVGMIMDYMIMHWESMDELKALIERDYDLGDRFPTDVGSAIEILCYEKIGRWTKDNWVWAEDPSYDSRAQNLADGKRDRRKQDALYVRLGSDGQIASTPSAITEAELSAAFEVAKRYMNFVCSLDSNESRGFDERRFAKVIDMLTLLFGTKTKSVAEASA